MLAVMVIVVLSGVAVHRLNDRGSGDRIYVMHAGSIVFTMEDLETGFEERSGYSMDTEGHGSVQASNMIRDGHRNPDVFLSSAISPIEALVTEKKVDWWISFATDELVIAYSDNSPQRSELDKARTGERNWTAVLSEEDFRFGRTDPELDPKGYRCIIMAKLAQELYFDPHLKDRILGPDRNPEQIFPEEALISHIELGQLDAIIAYRHEAVERGLRFIELPDEINLGSSDHAGEYSKAFYQNIAGENTLGSVIKFSLTIPKLVRNEKGSVEFCDFLLSNEGTKVLEEHGFRILLDLDAGGDISKVPPKLQEQLG